MNNITGYSNTIRVLMDVGYSERGARMAADLLMAKKDIVDRCEKLEEENRELRDSLSELKAALVMLDPRIPPRSRRSGPRHWSRLCPADRRSAP